MKFYINDSIDFMVEDVIKDIRRMVPKVRWKNKHNLYPDFDYVERDKVENLYLFEIGNYNG